MQKQRGKGVPPPGIEPGNFCLQDRCSTTEPHRRNFDYYRNHFNKHGYKHSHICHWIVMYGLCYIVSVLSNCLYHKRYRTLVSFSEYFLASSLWSTIAPVFFDTICVNSSSKCFYSTCQSLSNQLRASVTATDWG